MSVRRVSASTQDKKGSFSNGGGRGPWEHAHQQARPRAAASSLREAGAVPRMRRELRLRLGRYVFNSTGDPCPREASRQRRPRVPAERSASRAPAPSAGNAGFPQPARGRSLKTFSPWVRGSRSGRGLAFAGPPHRCLNCRSRSLRLSRWGRGPSGSTAGSPGAVTAPQGLRRTFRAALGRCPSPAVALRPSAARAQPLSPRTRPLFP